MTGGGTEDANSTSASWTWAKRTMCMVLLLSPHCRVKVEIILVQLLNTGESSRLFRKSTTLYKGIMGVEERGRVG